MTRKTSRYARKQKQPNARERSDGITMTRLNTTRLSAAEIESLLDPLAEALRAASTSCATFEQFVHLSTALHKARAIDESGIYRGLRPFIDPARTALDRLGHRAEVSGSWISPTLYGPEITALKDLVWAYRLMLLEVTYAEFRRIEKLAIARVASAGGRVVTPEQGLQHALQTGASA